MNFLVDFVASLFKWIEQNKQNIKGMTNDIFGIVSSVSMLNTNFVVKTWMMKRNVQSIEANEDGVKDEKMDRMRKLHEESRKKAYG